MLLAENTNVDVNVISIIANTIMSLILVIVTIFNAKSNNKIQKKIADSNCLTAEYPIKIKIFDYVNAYGTDFYNYLTKPLTDGQLGNNTIDYIVVKVDEMNTNLYSILTLLNITTFNEKLTNVIENLYQKSEELYLRLLRCKNNFVNDISIGHSNMSNLHNVNRFIADCLQNQQNYVLYAQNMSTETLDFLAKFKEVYMLQEEELEPNLKEFMLNNRIMSS